ncbi:hypothetical protein HBB16_05840 [Pseudonocardia sp. MCCB 268]|nr:hypothetical protein [Pseudonocardia cytotoxica]
MGLVDLALRGGRRLTADLAAPAGNRPSRASPTPAVRVLVVGEFKQGQRASW